LTLLTQLLLDHVMAVLAVLSDVVSIAVDPSNAVEI
jgi:hypothetical protein